MSQKQIDLSPDLKRLQNEGYELEVRDGYGIMSHIPYLTSNGETKYASLISNIGFQGDTAKYDGQHIIYFTGEYPCDQNGNEINPIRNSQNNSVFAGISVKYMFSNKPDGNYKDYYDKFTSYANIISAPAITKDPTQTAKTFNKVITNDESIFEYIDTNASRAGIDNCNLKLCNKKIAIVGLGGTGSYILDLIAKTPVKEIHLFDGDIFNQHNAFRAPGATKKEIFSQNVTKTSYLKDIYSNMHKGLVEHAEYINNSNKEILKQFDFVFISIDSGEAKRIIIDELIKNNIPFIDTGIGIRKMENLLAGEIRISLFDKSNYDEVSNYIDFEQNNDDVYSSNIQIAECNSLNATLAVIKWKKYFGVYADEDKKFQDGYSIEMGEIVHENSKI